MGGIRIKGPILGIDKPFVEIRHRRLKGIKKRFGIRLGTTKKDICLRVKPGETTSSCAIDLLHLGLIAHNPESFEIIGPLGIPRLIATLDIPKVNIESILRHA